MFYDAYHHIENISIPGPVSQYYVVGNICETDTFAENRSLTETREGEPIGFPQCGCLLFRNVLQL